MNNKAREATGFREIIVMFQRRAWVVGVCVALVALLALVFSLLQSKKYTATASLLIAQERVATSLAGSETAVPVGDPQRELDTNLKLLQLDVVAERAATKLGEGASAGEIHSQIEIESEEGSDVISIKATTGDAEESADVANAFGEEFVAFRAEADREKVQQAQARVESLLADPATSPARRVSLESRLDELQTLADLQTGGVSLVEPAQVPGGPSSPRPMRNAAIGVFAGLLLGLGLVLLLEQTDRRIRRPEELKDLFDLPLIGTIPESRLMRNGGPGKSTDRRSAEAFRMLRANLRYFDLGHDFKSVLVTSAGPAEGKTTVALGLAAAAAETGSRVLLIEADLHRPSLGPMLGLKKGNGLSTILSSRQPEPTKVKQRVAIEGVSKDAAPITIDVILAGPSPPNPAGLMESRAMTKLLEAAEAHYDLVVIDTPPVGVISDPIPLFDQVSGVVLVSRMKETTRDTIARFKSHLDAIHAPILGVIANDVERGTGYSSYDYYAEPEPKSS